MSRSPELNALAPVLTGGSAGHYTLPAEVVDALQVRDRIAVPALPPRPGADGGRQAYVEQVLQAAADGAPWPRPTALLRLQAQQAEHDLAVDVLRDAQDVAASRLLGALIRNGERIVVEHLRPAHAETLDGARGAAVLLREVQGWTDRELLTAPAEVQRAAVDLDGLVARYGAIRRTHSILTDGRTERDDGIFAEVRNLRELYGSAWPGRKQRAYKPGPVDDPRARLVWLVTGDPLPQPWCPTAAERDAAWLAEFSPAARAQRMSEVA